MCADAFGVNVTNHDLLAVGHLQIIIDWILTAPGDSLGQNLQKVQITGLNRPGDGLPSEATGSTVLLWQKRFGNHADTIDMFILPAHIVC